MTAATLRAFVAADIPPAAITLLGEFQEALKRRRFPVRWVKPAGIHLTLKFLGNIPTEDAAPLATAMDEAAAGLSAMSLAIRGVGVFPGLRKARVLWAGLSGDIEALFRLQAAVEARLEALGFARERRPFKAHLTLGRFSGHVDPGQLAEALQASASFGSDPFAVKTVTLFKSDLKPAGAVYSPLAVTALR
jgi:2'-5' RNA ligase